MLAALGGLTIRDVPHVPLQIILSWLPRLGDRISFLIALGGRFTEDLVRARESVTQRIFTIGSSLGWDRFRCRTCGKLKKGHTCTPSDGPVDDLLEAVKVFAKMWQSARYCQECGRECHDHRLMSMRTEKGVCTNCLEAEWAPRQCGCGIKVALVDHKPLSKPGCNLTNHCWYAVCRVRYQYIRDVSPAEARHIDSTLPRSQTGCTYSAPATSIVVPFSTDREPDPLPPLDLYPPRPVPVPVPEKKRRRPRKRAAFSSHKPTPPKRKTPLVRKSPRRATAFSGWLGPPQRPKIPVPPTTHRYHTRSHVPPPTIPTCGLIWPLVPIVRVIPPRPPPLPVPDLEPLRERMKRRRRVSPPPFPPKNPRRSARLRSKGENNERKEGFYYYH